VEILFELLDEDSSGTVTLDEVISFASGGAGWQGYHGERVRQHSRSPEQPIRSTRPIAKQPWWNATRNMYNQLPKKELEAIRYLVANKAYNIVGGAGAVKVFASLGRDQNGTLDPDDFHKFVRERLLLSSSEMPDKHVALAFHSIDTDLSGKIELRELLALVYEYVDAADDSRQEVFQPRGRSPTRKSRPKLHAPRTIAAQPKRSAKSIADKPYWKAQRRKGFPKKKLEKIRHHLYSAAYRYAGKDYAGLFKHLDKEHNGYLDPDEFQSFMRRVLRLPPRVVSDADIAIVFRIIDDDDSGAVDIDEVIAFANKGAGWHGYHATTQTPPPADDSADLSDADVVDDIDGLEDDMDM
jgi:Ca2+-binding EF-hand superfamily protein